MGEEKPDHKYGPANSITDVDWLHQIAELLGELDPEIRSARCPECGSSQLVYCEEGNLHYRMTTTTLRAGASAVTATPKKPGRTERCANQWVVVLAGPLSLV